MSLITNPKPKYSIVVPAYNVEDYLGDCLDSIASQGRADIEAVVVDDGSSDSTGRVLERYASERSFIRAIHQENKGLLAARRVGYANARGEYILSVDGDDGLLRGAVGAIDDVLKSCDPDCVTFGFTRRAGALRNGRASVSPAFSRPSRQEMIALLAGTRKANSIWSKCVRRACMGVDVDFSRYGRLQNGEDLLQSITIVERSSAFAHIDAPLYFYRDNAESITKTFRDSDFADIAVARNEVHALIAREGLERDLDQAACAVDYMQVMDVASSLCRSSVPRTRARELLDDVVDSTFYRRAVDGAGPTRNLRFDYQPLAPLLSGRCYDAFCLAARARSIAIAVFHALKKEGGNGQ